MAANPLVKDFVTRVRAGLSITRDLTALPNWICENTRSPGDRNKPWSFEGHEFQRGILADPSTDLVIRKCAQVGLSEISVRMILGITSIYQGITAIFTLPTSSEAGLFAKGRFDPVISASPYLSENIERDTDNVSVKKIGQSFIYIRGTYTTRAAISIPASCLTSDEIDFSSQEALSAYTSRLGHTAEHQVIRRRFSTPTVTGFGVSQLFEESRQSWYGVRCDHCGKWETPRFLEDVVVPGYDRDLLDLEREDLLDSRYQFKNAYVRCPGCHSPLSTANLADPSKRMWIAAYPERDMAGYQVQPIDLIGIVPVYRTLKNIQNYARRADFFNFAVGAPYEDADTSFVKSAVLEAHQLQWVQPRANAAVNTVIGLDVGKTSHLVVARPAEGGKLHVLHVERIKSLTNETLPERVAQLYEWYGAKCLVIDAMPEFSLALGVMDRLPRAKAFACYFTGAKPALSFISDLNEEERVVKVDRNAVISDTARLVNGGKILFPRCPEQSHVIEHLCAIKRVKRPNAKGVEVETWINTGPDHYGFALFYARTAQQLLGYQLNRDLVPSLPLPTRARIGGNTQTQPANLGYLDRRLHG
jgi:hypothetical protein